jgi:xanthine dehydrogenase iron-sulfur cluster and FAD-binding subunit A
VHKQEEARYQARIAFEGLQGYIDRVGILSSSLIGQQWRAANAGREARDALLGVIADGAD